MSMSSSSAVWGETVRLCKGFMRVRHRFPNKQGRSKLRRWTNMFFALKQLEYHQIVERRGLKVADAQAAKWRAEAHQDLSTS